MLTVGSLFAGIGGFDLGLERAGMRSVWQSELDPFCQRVLAKHWPDVLRVPDVRDVGRDTVPQVDVICGGFPCQDISLAGKGAGLDGARSGLWFEYARIVGELRPRYVIVENVAALVRRGLPAVLGSLSELGYDAEWGVVSAADAGAPHLRKRLWIVAYPNGQGQLQQEGPELQVGRRTRDGGSEGGDVADADRKRREEGLQQPPWPGERPGPGDAERASALPDADGGALQPWRVGGRAAQAGGPEWWAVEPPVGRVAHGVPNRLDQLAALGNALVPQVAEWLGRRVVAYEEEALSNAA